MPLMKTHYMKHALAFFIALAIGTLYSTAVLQLLPEVCHPSIHPSFYLINTLTAHKHFFFLLCFALLEKLVHLWPSAPLSVPWSYLCPLCPAFALSGRFSRALISTVEGFLVLFCPYCITDQLGVGGGGLYLCALYVVSAPSLALRSRPARGFSWREGLSALFYHCCMFNSETSLITVFLGIWEPYISVSVSQSSRNVVQLPLSVLQIKM